VSTRSTEKWEIQSSTGSHFDALDGMRGVAILMVVASHSFYSNPSASLPMRLFGLLFDTGWMGVPIFFVLSGFLIAYPFFREREKDRRAWYARGYVRRRVGKIIPPFYLSIIIFVAYYFIRFSDPRYLVAGLQWACGIANFIPPAVHLYTPYWSLLVEVQFYILLPVLFFALRGARSRAVAWFTFAIFLLGPFIVRQWTWPDAVDRDSLAFLMNRFPCSLDFFGWGVLFAGLFVSGGGLKQNKTALGCLGYAGIAVLVATVGVHMLWTNLFDIGFHPRRWSVEAFHLLPSVSVFLLLFFLYIPGSWGFRLFAFGPLRFIGLVSYEWFLFHQPLTVLAAELVPNAHGNVTLYLLRTMSPLLVSFVFSVLVYRYFSFPLLQWCRGNPARQKNRGTAPGAAAARYAPPDGNAL
jgi:peptidoglycan/LPS O-acetylase OafA/YrhL